MTADLENFNRFLSGIDLVRYREKYTRIKLVELDMPRDIQAIRHLYRCYWEQRQNFPDYESFYEIYAADLREQLEAFRQKTMFSVETFHRGLPARIYRTWASLLTQIQGGYVAESIYGKGKAVMSADLDYQGVDISIDAGDKKFNVQVKKETMSREVRTPWQLTKKDKTIVNVSYETAPRNLFTQKGKESIPYTRWKKKWEGKLARLPNGFVIFLPGMFERNYLTTP